MPIIVENNNYTNTFGYSGNTYKSNAGDRTALELTVAESIRITTVNNPFSFDPILNIITSPAESWTDEGFRVNDTVLVSKYDSAGTLLMGYYLTITSLTNTELNLNNWYPNLFYDIAQGEIMTIIAYTNSSGSATPRKREDLLLSINHSLNDQQGTSASLIDGELTRMFYGNLSVLSIGSTLNGSIVGNQSGQFVESSTIEYLGLNSDNFQQYKITFIFNNSGIYEKDWFALGDCLKLFVNGLWSSKIGEVFNRTEFNFDDQANTGWFNEANNISIPTGGVVVSPINQLKYNIANNLVSFTVDLAGTSVFSLAIGSAYVSIDDVYYKNNIYNQNNLTYLIPTTTITSSSNLSSYDGAGINSNANYEIEIISIITSGANATITLDWKPNSNLTNFFETDRLDGDKLFYLWVKIGNTNHLVYNSQLIKELPVGGALIMNNDYGFLDHSQNVTSILGNNTSFSADTEDDIAYYGTFNLNFGNVNYNSINLRVEAYNSVTLDTFTLQQTNFNFTGVTYQPSTGKWLLNEVANINTELPNTSEKEKATVVLTGTTSAGSYEVGVYYPFLLNWKYWLTLLGVNADFAPTQNQNWEQYDNLANWNLRMVVELNNNNLAFIHTNNFIDNPYDNNSDITSSVELQKQSDNSVVTVIPTGDLLFIETTHILTTGNWDLAKCWGMITVEPELSSPRSICSTIVPFDNNLSNPLTPISGLLCSMTLVSSNTIKLKCKFDPSKINTSNGIKISAKIKQGLTNIVVQNKITTNNVNKVTTTNNIKIIA
tara:strand:- start:18277 stop:20598 length:2322 start_codon:yes stop_codon:yes gene_type:complete